LNAGAARAKSGGRTARRIGAGANTDRGLMARNRELTASDEYQDLLLESPGFTEFLLGLAMMSVSRLSAGSSSLECTITVECAGGTSTVAASSEEGQRLDETQYAIGDGPCLTAEREQRTVLVGDFRNDPQWARYRDEAGFENVLSVLATPIPAGRTAHAALNCYAASANAFDAAAVELVEEQAESMSRILRLALKLHAAESSHGALRAALKSRAVVDAALSLIMLQTRGGRDRALEILHAASQSSNRRLQEVASDIVDGGHFAGPSADHHE